MVDIEQEFSELLADSSKGFDARLAEVKCDYCINGINLSGKFFYLTFKNAQPSLDEFVQYIYWRIINYCIPYRIRRKYEKKFEETHDHRYWVELTTKAKSLFIRAKGQRPTTGEPGELILFMLLESVLKAPQFVSKMYLKTSTRMPLHGSDGIHVSYSSNNKILTLYWGESKIHQELSSALGDICGSIASFITPADDGDPPKFRDLDIIRDHSSLEEGDLKETLLKYFDPYEKVSNDVEEVFACFAGFDYSLLSKLNTLNRAQLVQLFESQYLGRIKSAIDLFGEKIREHNIHSLKFVFFLIPFKSIEDLRAKFFQQMAIENDS